MKKMNFCAYLLAGLAISISAVAQRGVSRQCSAVGGTMATNLPVIGQATTLGNATGDLKGAVAAAILSTNQNSDGTASFVVQHYLVTESGDTILFNQATALTMPLSETRFAILDYPVHIKGGTGKYANAKGDLNAIGEVDLSLGQTVFRYSGTLCLANGN
jgi:hypothetical protein